MAIRRKLAHPMHVMATLRALLFSLSPRAPRSLWHAPQRTALRAVVCGHALLTLGCTRAEAGTSNQGEQSSTATASKSVLPPPPPLPVSSAAQPMPGAARAPAAAPATVSEQERELYAIILRLAREPAALSELAPKARVRFAGSKRAKRPLKDTREELGWIADTDIKLVGADAPADELEESSAHCWPDQLRCTISQPGGETSFFFARVGQPPRLVLREIENAEP